MTVWLALSEESNDFFQMKVLARDGRLLRSVGQKEWGEVGPSGHPCWNHHHHHSHHRHYHHHHHQHYHHIFKIFVLEKVAMTMMAMGKVWRKLLQIYGVIHQHRTFSPLWGFHPVPGSSFVQKESEKAFQKILGLHICCIVMGENASSMR